jgi:hypothetical protein
MDLFPAGGGGGGSSGVVALTAKPHLAPRLKKLKAALLSLLDHHGLFYGELYPYVVERCWG